MFFRLLVDLTNDKSCAVALKLHNAVYFASLIVIYITDFYLDI